MSRKRVLMRVDFNVPIVAGQITSDLRIRAAIPGIKELLDSGAQVLLVSHLGRPAAPEPSLSLRPVAQHLSKLLGTSVKFIADWQNVVIDDDDDIVLFENIRFLPGELANSPELGKYLASLADLFVMDAFASIHRAHASTCAVADYIGSAVAGPLVLAECQALDKILSKPTQPLVAILGGAKIADKIESIASLSKVAKYICIGGAMAHTCLRAQGVSLGASIYEMEMLPRAGELLANAAKHGVEVILPTDFVVQDGTVKTPSQFKATDKAMDIGPATIQAMTAVIDSARTILWNGPLGVFEEPNFANGSFSIATAVSNSEAYSVVGGGDSIAVLEACGMQAGVSYISTAGGAFLEYLASRRLPGLVKLNNLD